MNTSYPALAQLRVSRAARGAAVQVRVIGALMMREALNRYGHHNLGFFWVIAEPLVFTSCIILLWSLVGLHHGTGVEVVPFALTGYSFITMWRHVVAHAMGALRQNITLEYHRHVRVLDSLIAMALLEIVACFSSFVIAYIPLYLLGQCPPIRDPLALVGGYALAGVFSFGFGLFLAGVSNMSEVLHHITPAIMYMSMPLTGIFTMQAWLPEKARKLLDWSPLVNGIEMFRSGLFPEDIATYWSSSYLFLVSVVMVVVGYAVFSFSRERANS